MSPITVLRESLRPAVDLLYPPRCPLCGEGLAAQDGLCPPCWGELDRPSGGAVDEGIVAATFYNEASRRLVLAFKHGGRIAHAGLFARMIAARLPTLEGDWLMVPVPLHRGRLWRRGYNQASLIGRELARRTGHAAMPDALVRTRATPSLGGLGRERRAMVMRGAIAVRPARRSLIAGRNVVLVDDVVTSGATTSACAAALREAGAGRILTACFARVAEPADRPA